MIAKLKDHKTHKANNMFITKKYKSVKEIV